MTNATLTRNRRRWILQGLREADKDARLVKSRTGLDMCPRGQALADYVTRELSTETHTANEIANRAGYRNAHVCAGKLAHSGHAPLGRLLLERHFIDSHPELRAIR